MDWNAMFPNLSVMWTRWSEYTVVTDRGGTEYLVPAPGASSVTYDCARQPDALVADALELGRQLFQGIPAPEKNVLCTAFAARYGLLGLEAEKGTSYLDDPDLPPFCRPLNGPDYGEDLWLFQVHFMELYQHFTIAKGMHPVWDNPRPADLSGLLNYRLTSGRTPQLVWELRSMLSVIRLTYARLISEPAGPLKVCKNCGKVYYNSHAKSEFCSTRCRNYYNVRVFREREKGIETRR